MFARATDYLRNDDGSPYKDRDGKTVACSRIAVYDTDTEEKVGSCFQADTLRGTMLCFKTVGTAVVRESRELPSGEVLYDLVVLQKHGNFDLVHRETGEVLAEYRRPRAN